MMKYVLLVMMVLALLINCEGPAGPTGPEGAQGIAGNDGATGPQGPEGNSDVSIETFSFTISQADVQDGSVNYERTISEIDDAILENGTVIAYLDDGNNFYEALPSTACVDETDDGSIEYCIEMSYAYSLNTLTIGLFSTTSYLSWNPTFSISIKAVIIGGPTQLGKKANVAFYQEYLNNPDNF